jgi:hypothetical protein
LAFCWQDALKSVHAVQRIIILELDWGIRASGLAPNHPNLTNQSSPDYAGALGRCPAAEGALALWRLWGDTDDEKLQAAVLEFLTEQERWELATPEARAGIEREIAERARAFIDRWTPGGE